ncbi:hypothetical protein OJF2_37020 [Aquisphaera giovannonii]|uniref:Poly(3-hydroxyalkanoate) polymerase subunit PhaE n=1 Tax=Aquisphaera giovannonii TaxID=406548 RepID=A0A5B9W4K0_9BACT|nr:hypothetical protein [Aquisphaera giovannonii]QEH35157.1 hypothetical protein OJF2_37020 [Aquisphaera giovannonii]
MSTTHSKPKPEAANGPATPAPADPFSEVASFWARWLEQSSRGTQALLEAFQAAGDPQQVQQRWLDAFSKGAESFMRSPAYLDLMKNTLRGVVELKVMQDQAISDFASQFGLPLAADIKGLFERLHSTEQTILRRLDAIEERIRAIEPK